MHALSRLSSSCRARLCSLILAFAGTLLLAFAAPIAGASAGTLSFNGTFDTGLAPWQQADGGAQCANYGTPSQNQRLRGDFYVDSTTFGEGHAAARFYLPPSQLPTFPLQGCELTDMRTIGLGTDDYYGYMFYVPHGFTTGTTDPSAFWGITVAQFHFQNIWGSPIEFELHDNHMTLALETGSCNNHLTADPGCQWISNADAPGGNPGNLGAFYAIPPGMQTGVWHELIMHVHWASDSTGQIQVWHRLEGQANWTQTVNLSGIPTVQWDATTGCCAQVVADKVGAYRGISNIPVSVWEDNITIGSDFPTVAASMPMAPGGGTPIGGNPPHLIPVARPVPRANTTSAHTTSAGSRTSSSRTRRAARRTTRKTARRAAFSCRRVRRNGHVRRVCTVRRHHSARRRARRA